MAQGINEGETIVRLVLNNTDQGVLAVTHLSGLNITSDVGTGVITLSGNALMIQQALSQILFIADSKSHKDTLDIKLSFLSKTAESLELLHSEVISLNASSQSKQLDIINTPNIRSSGESTLLHNDMEDFRVKNPNDQTTYSVTQFGTVIITGEVRSELQQGLINKRLELDEQNDVERTNERETTSSPPLLTNNGATPTALNASGLLLTGEEVVSVEDVTGIALNDPSGTIVATFGTTDADTLDSHSYSIVSDPSGWFEIINDNELAVQTGANVDYESATSVALIIRTEDSTGNTFDETITVAINDAEGTYTGTALQDLTTGSSEEDTMYGGDGVDYLRGGDGNDYLYGESDTDALWGGAGADTIDGGVGDNDIARYTGGDAVNINLLTSTFLGGHAEGDVLIDIERIEGSTFDDTLVADNVGRGLLGERGSDIITGGTGNDTLYGDYNGGPLAGDGDDTIDGGSGDDSMIGGTGEDVFVFAQHIGDTDIITDFTLSDDTIDLTHSSFASFDSIADLNLSDNGSGDALVDLGAGHVVVLQGVDHTTLTHDHFDGIGNSAPIVANAIANESIADGVAYNYSFAANTFDDADVGDTLTYSATLAGGGALPGWLSFDAATRTFSGTPASGDVGTISVRVTATDNGAGTLSVSDDFNISVGTIVSGTTGDDRFDLEDGVNTADGGAGNDEFNLYGGTNVVTGGAGADIFDFRLTSISLRELYYDKDTTFDNLIMDFEDGVDTIRMQGFAYTSIGFAPAKDDVLSMSYDAANDWTFITDEFGDFTFKINGDVTATLDDTDFIFNYGTGHRFGTTGDDSFTYNYASAYILGAGNDTLNDLNFNQAFLGDGDDYVTHNHAQANESWVNGGDGNDTIIGGDASSTNNAHYEILNGGAGDDVIDGRGQADIIRGGMGQDTLTGGNYNGGAGVHTHIEDVFIFDDVLESQFATADLITDIKNGHLIDLSNIAILTAFSDFDTFSYSSGPDETLLHDTDTGFAIRFSGDVTGFLDSTFFDF